MPQTKIQRKLYPLQVDKWRFSINQLTHVARASEVKHQHLTEIVSEGVSL
jgi:hypothetical protein